MDSDINIEEVKKLLDAAEDKIRKAKSELFGSKITQRAKGVDEVDEENVIQGVFDGEKMIGSDEKEYQVPANYASKSKLIQGDILKLTISSDGRYVYKQIGPIERKNLIGVLEEIDEGEYQVDVSGKKFKVLLASVTFFKARAGDKLSIVVPKDEETDWAAVDNIVNQKDE